MMQHQELTLSISTAAKASTCQWRFWQEINAPEELRNQKHRDFIGSAGSVGASTSVLPSFREYIHHLREIYERSVLREYQNQFPVWIAATISEVLCAANPTPAIKIAPEPPDHLAEMAVISPIGQFPGVTRATSERWPAAGQSFYSIPVSVPFESCLISDEIPFLLANQDGYRVQICRYSAHVRKETKIQLAGMVWLAETSGIKLAPTAEVRLASGKTVAIAVKELVRLWEENLSRLGELLKIWQDAGDFSWWDCQRICGSCEACEVAISAHDDLLKISGLGPRLREKLHKEGIRTCRELALRGSKLVSPKILTLARLQVASNDQRKSEFSEKTSLPRVRFNALAPNLQNLPDANRGDLYLDFENDPLWGWTSADHTGLLYLAGLVFRSENPEKTQNTARLKLKNLSKNNAPRLQRQIEKPGEIAATLGYRYLSFWAHERAEEKDLLVRLVDFLQVHLRRYPAAHIYHYSEQEKLFLRRLAKRHRVLQTEVEEICARCIDLLPMVQAAVLNGNGGYSLKDLEAIYMGPLHRQGKYQQGAESVVAYDIWNRSRGEKGDADDSVSAGDSEASAQTLSEIAAYNEYDCCSTLVLQQWLVEQYNLQAVKNRCLYRGNRPHYKKGPADFDESVLE